MKNKTAALFHFTFDTIAMRGNWLVNAKNFQNGAAMPATFTAVAHGNKTMYVNNSNKK
jgi:hypothetical protein